jgi:hypothetical protein
MRPGLTDIAPEIAEAAGDIHFVEHSHGPNLGEVDRDCERPISRRRLHTIGREALTIAINAITDAYFAVAEIIVQCNITLAF